MKIECEYEQEAYSNNLRNISHHVERVGYFWLFILPLLTMKIWLLLRPTHNTCTQHEDKSRNNPHGSYFSFFMEV